MSDEGGAFLFGLFVGLALAFLAGINGTASYWRADAIANGVAEWRIDNKTGAASFVWLKPENQSTGD